MNSAVKIDQRAFNRGVKEVLHLKPLARIVKVAVQELKDGRKPQDKVQPVAKR